MICLLVFCVLSLTSPWLPPEHCPSLLPPLPRPVSGRRKMQTGDCEFYLSGLSGTVLEIVTTWKAVVGFRRNEKDEKAVLLGLYSGREDRKMRFNECLVSKLRSDHSPLEENVKIRKVKTFVRQISSKSSALCFSLK